MGCSNASIPVQVACVLIPVIVVASLIGGLVWICCNYDLRKCRKRTSEEKRKLYQRCNEVQRDDDSGEASSLPLQPEDADATRETLVLQGDNVSDELSSETRRQLEVIDRATARERMNTQGSNLSLPGISGIANTGNTLPEPARIGPNQNLSSPSSDSSIISPYSVRAKPQQSSFQPPNISPSAISGKGKAIYRRSQGDEVLTTVQIEIHSPSDKEDKNSCIDLLTATEAEGDKSNEEEDVPEEEENNVQEEEENDVPEEENIVPETEENVAEEEDDTSESIEDSSHKEPTSSSKLLGSGKQKNTEL